MARRPSPRPVASSLSTSTATTGAPWRPRGVEPLLDAGQTVDEAPARRVPPAPGPEQRSSFADAPLLLRALLALARTHPTRHQVSQRLWDFYRWCADSDIPELAVLARTVETP